MPRADLDVDSRRGVSRVRSVESASGGGPMSAVLDGAGRGDRRERRRRPATATRSTGCRPAGWRRPAPPRRRRRCCGSPPGTGLAVVARGAGTKLGWGAPPRRLDLLLDTGRLDRVVEHAAGDLVVVVQAGVRLAALADRLAGRRPAARPGRGGARRDRRRHGRDRPVRAAPAAARRRPGPDPRRHPGPRGRGGRRGPAARWSRTSPATTSPSWSAASYGTLGLVTEAAFRLHPVAAGRRRT